MPWTGQSGTGPAGGSPTRRAPVAPRVRRGAGDAALPLEQRIRALLARRACGAINLVGPGGSGKTTALEHLQATIEPDAPLFLVDAPFERRAELAAQIGLVVFTSTTAADPKQFTTFVMAPWTDDDAIEYLLATHPARCRAVIEKIRKLDGRQALEGLPELWRIVLDEMAADESIPEISAALGRFLDRELCDPTVRGRAERFCLSELAPRGAASFSACAFEPRVGRLLRHRLVRVMLAARALASGLCRGTVWNELSGRLPAELIEGAAALAASSPAALDCLDAMTRSRDKTVHAMAASVLHATGIGWRPMDGHIPHLQNARLEGAHWADVRLAGAHMDRADLRRAVLAGADLSGAHLSLAKLCAASFRRASLRGAVLDGGDLAGAELSGVRADAADLRGADLSRADLGAAVLRRAVLQDANLSNALFHAADLREADLRGAAIDQTDFSSADLSRAQLGKLPLRNAIVRGARFRGADLVGCDLEEAEADGCDFRDADLSCALLTGSVFRGADLRRARLCDCGLADVDWEGADLRDADLRGATFHMGSTRSGLVGSNLPCEGGRTGYYTDDYHDREFKDPREVRKANLRRADLRHARIDGVDFYLVDLRDACYTNSQADHFARCGAIL